MKTLKNLALSLIIFSLLFSCTKEEDVIPTSLWHHTIIFLHQQQPELVYMI